ncbi:putative nucleic acid binding protein [Lutibacter oceani]|uniref:Putative nucleic acid binding protein n=1 Tax=Lutibacter oceani TaxID=1853311 RepID=A0A3D9S3C4_9FLAO|nr:hypothetical protein [Lutibacter oceani]REE83122.1 putative nucleic acid binding protein [Lutibacter oceani]
MNNIEALKTKYFKILLAGLTLIIIGLFFVINLYNKPFKDVKNSKAEFVISAQELINDFQVDENLANKKYVDKLIQVKGEIVDISITKGNSSITLKDINGFSSIICHMLPEDNLNSLKLKKGDFVHVKGMCTGYLLDIIMVRCILINDNLNEK